MIIIDKYIFVVILYDEYILSLLNTRSDLYMGTFLYEKIIREKLLERVIAAKGTYNYTELTPEESLKELLLKLQEETEEVVSTTSTKEMVDELADVMEVIECLLDVKGLTMSDLQKARQQKDNSRGKLRYSEKVHTITLPEISEFQHELSYLRQNNDRYPELSSES